MINKIHQRRRGVHCFLVPPPAPSLSLLPPKSIPIRLSRFPIDFIVVAFCSVYPSPDFSSAFLSSCKSWGALSDDIGEEGGLLSRCIISVFTGSRRAQRLVIRLYSSAEADALLLVFHYFPRRGNLLIARRKKVAWLGRLLSSFPFLFEKMPRSDYFRFHGRDGRN